MAKAKGDAGTGGPRLTETELERISGGYFKGVDGINAEIEVAVLSDPSLTVEDRVTPFKPPLDSGKGS